MRRVDLHLHSNASDGELAPAVVVSHADAAGVSIMALTDHDTIAGVAEARDRGKQLGIEVIAGCEFSVAASWGEMHLLGYFLPTGVPRLLDFLGEQRRNRRERALSMVRKLNARGVELEFDDVENEVSGAIGRPHVARALMARGAVSSFNEAFERYLGTGRPGYVPKVLPGFRHVAELVRSIGGVTSAAHLGERAEPASLRELRAGGLDAVEARHPRHDPATSARIERLATKMGLLLSGGSDWHGPSSASPARPGPGELDVPANWVDSLRSRARERSDSRLSI